MDQLVWGKVKICQCSIKNSMGKPEIGIMAAWDRMWEKHPKMRRKMQKQKDYLISSTSLIVVFLSIVARLTLCFMYIISSLHRRPAHSLLHVHYLFYKSFIFGLGTALMRSGFNGAFNLFFFSASRFSSHS
jgi:hypothetical protein